MEGTPRSKNPKPIESHKTASWANIEKAKPVSSVSEPSDMQIINAKEYVDENQK